MEVEDASHSERITDMYREWCGQPCSECKKSCIADESMPCSPDCGLLGEYGNITDFHKCLEAGCDTILLAEIQIGRDEATKWQRLVDMREVDFEKEGVDTDATLAVWSVEFDNGHVADFKVCSGTINLFLDIVLFEPGMHGALFEEFVPDCPDNIIGDHFLAPFEGGNAYVLRITTDHE